MKGKGILARKQKGRKVARVARHALAHAVMATLATAAGVILLTVPGMAEIACRMPGRRKSPEAVAAVLASLYRKGFILLSGERGQERVALTEKGKRIAYLNSIALKKPTPTSWNQLWFMVSFDIPALERRARDSLRHKLKEIGFKEYQKSLYVYPLPCESELNFIIDYYGVRQWVTYFHAADMPDDLKLRKQFSL